MSDRIHIYPVRGRKTDHRTKKDEWCWCDPEIMQVCSESNDKGKCKKKCFKCGGRGLVQPYDEELNYLIIHHEGQLDEHLNKLRK